MAKQTSKFILAQVSLIFGSFLVGAVIGLIFRPNILGEVEIAEDAQTADDSGADTGEQHIALTKQAFENLELKLGPVQWSDYWRYLRMPGEVVEIAGQSDLSLAAPVTGVIEQVFVRNGQAVGPDDSLFTLRITDKDLISAQTSLLNVLTSIDVKNQEAQRLDSLPERTALGSKRRELDYELTELLAEKEVRIQEIVARGLPQEALQKTLRSKKLTDRLTVSMPEFLIGETNPVPGRSIATKKVSITPSARDLPFSVEATLVHPGMAVQRGQDLCDLARHSQLYIRGQAFESDLSAISALAEKGWVIQAEFGHRHDEQHQHISLREDLRVLRIDNKVDAETQTFSFYMSLDNKTVQQPTIEEGRVFQQWQYKPGQRVHLRVPVEQWKQQIVLPIAAVAIEGPDAFVFREHVLPWHEQDAEDGVFIEFDPVPVRLIHRDERFAVIANDNQIKESEKIALNAAYKLHLALQIQDGSGGGHAHDH